MSSTPVHKSTHGSLRLKTHFVVAALALATVASAVPACPSKEARTSPLLTPKGTSLAALFSMATFGAISRNSPNAALPTGSSASMSTAALASSSSLT
ncbi:hypothetical protein EDD21DRAFT_421691 [Dissophora ornata]|nr:hypothetical protein EDD21DRAFT_421691 [Dissophora ornata]